MANLLIVTADSSGISHWLEALNGHHQLQLVDKVENVVAHKSKLGAIDLLILDAGFVEDDYSRLSSMLNCADKLIVIGNNCPEEMRVRVVVDGAWGYSEKSINAGLTFRMVKSVLNNEIWLERHQIPMVLSALHEKNSARQAQRAKFLPKLSLSCLTQRELEVATLIYQGEGNSNIASKLDISERTVKAHLSAIFRKLNVQDRFQLVIFLKDLNMSEA